MDSPYVLKLSKFRIFIVSQADPSDSTLLLLYLLIITLLLSIFLHLFCFILFFLLHLHLNNLSSNYSSTYFHFFPLDFSTLFIDIMEWKYVGEAGIELKARNSHSMGIVSLSSPSLSFSLLDPVPCPVSPSSSNIIQFAADGQTIQHSTPPVTPHTHTSDATNSHILKAGKLLKKSYLVIYGGASPEEGPMGDTVYASLPDPKDIGE